MDINHLTHKVIGCAYKVHNVLGPGFLEKVYENSLTLELRKLGIDVRQQVNLPVWYDGQRVGLYFPDLWVDGQLIVEVALHEDSSLHDESPCCTMNHAASLVNSGAIPSSYML
jgi:GxxExxY protein